MFSLQRHEFEWLVDALDLLVFSYDGRRLAPFGREAARILPAAAPLEAARTRLGGAFQSTDLARAHDHRALERVTWAEGEAYVVPAGERSLVVVHPEQALSMRSAMATHDTSHALGLVVAWSRLAESGDPTGVRAAMEGIRGAVEAARLALAGDGEHRELTGVRDVVDEVTQILEPLASQRELQVTVDVPDDLVVAAPRSVLYRALWNVVENAYTALGVNQSVTISADAREGRAFIRVDDDGPGVPPRLVPTLFTRRRGPNQSRGIGLSGVAESLESAGGAIRLEERAAPGACFVMELPSAPEPEHKRSGVHPLALGPSILLVEDDRALLDLLAQTFEACGFSVEARREGLPGDVDTFDAALIDLHLATTDGLSLVSRLVERGFRGDLHLMSGGEPPLDRLGGLDFRFHRKPFDPTKLADAVRASLDADRAAARSSAAIS